MTNSRLCRLLAILTLCLLAPSAFAVEIPKEVIAAQRARIKAIAKAVKTTVAVFARGGAGGGSGVVVTADGYCLTNFHVAKPAGNHMKCGMSDGRLYDAVIVGSDPTGDVALIKLLGRKDFAFAELADSDKVQVGDWCFAAGNPFLLATDFQPTVTYGIVSGVHRYQYPAGTLLEYADCIQTDAAINPGNSGGPLFNDKGQLIGINGRGSFEKRGRVNVGVGYAISINQIKNFMGYLRSGRIVDHATLGATVTTDEDNKVIVTNILDSSDAYRRGLRFGDEIVAFGGRNITTVNGFKNALGIFPKGWRVPLSYSRKGKRFNVVVRLAGVHSQGELQRLTQGRRRPRRPAPRPGDKKKKKKKGKQPRRPTRNPHRAVKIPPAIAKMIQVRPGYANFYFNKLERDRVWKAFLANTQLLNYSGDWSMTGRLEDAGAYEIRLSEKETVGPFGGANQRVDMSKDLSEQLDPDSTGGLFTALTVWRQLIIRGPNRFGQVYYLGTGPVPGLKGVCDVLVGTYRDVEANFYFDPTNGRMVSMEMYPDIEVDPCELRFSDYRKVGNAMLPHKIIVLHGDKKYGTILVKSYALPKSATTKKAAS